MVGDEGGKRVKMAEEVRKFMPRMGAVLKGIPNKSNIKQTET